MDQIKAESLDWAKTHINKYGDTDIFPVPFEYSAINHVWTSIKAKLSLIDMAIYECRPFQRMLIPKPEGGYRVAIQLDPIDAILYTSMVYEAADLIEQQRVSIDLQVSCSYRVHIDSNGQIFRKSNGWSDFHGKSLELASSGNYQYVVLADIADYYNQIGHHRVRNALEVAGVSPERAKNLENFLMNLTGGQSRGLPVGPTASIILAEACLGDVDSFLLRKGLVFTRYVDDFRIFATTRAEAYRALHDLSEYLYTAHRLALQSHKTRIISVDEFFENELIDPEKLEEQQKIRLIQQYIEEMNMFGYPEFDDVDSGLEINEGIVVLETIKELFDYCVATPRLHLGVSRYILRRATKLRTNALQSHVLFHLEKLAPVMREVAIYLGKTTRSQNISKVSVGIINFLQNSDLAFVPFVKLWLIYVLTEKVDSSFEETLRKICESARDQMGIRPQALLAKKLKHLDWVRAQKEIWQNNGPWDRRAIIWSATALPSDERNYWLKRVQNAGDILDNAVAQAVQAGVSEK